MGGRLLKSCSMKLVRRMDGGGSREKGKRIEGTINRSQRMTSRDMYCICRAWS